jgi:hypothetical protein
MTRDEKYQSYVLRQFKLCMASAPRYMRRTGPDWRDDS